MYQMLLHAEDSSLGDMMECQLVNRVFWVSLLPPFRSKWSKKRWIWRQHAPLKGDYVPIDTASYPRRLESSTLLWESQNFALLHTPFHSFQLHIKVFAQTHFQTGKHCSSPVFMHCTLFHIAWTCMSQWSVSHLLANFTTFSQFDLCVESVMLWYLLNNCSWKQIQQM